MLYVFFSIILAFIFQMQVLPVLGIRLDLLLFVTLYYGLLYGGTVGAGTGIVIGLFEDVFSGGMLGAAPIGLVICGLLAGYTRKVLLLRYWIIRVGLVFVLTMLNSVIYTTVSKMFFQIQLFSVFKIQWFAIALGNAVFAGLVFWLVDRAE